MRLKSLAGHTRTDEPKAGETQAMPVSDECMFAMLLTLLKKIVLHSRCVQISTRSGASLGTFNVCKECITDMPVGKQVLYLSGQKWPKAM